MKIILLGAPGAGKGTQAAMISAKYNIPSISTGDILRGAIKAETELGLRAKSYMDAGQLVPDEVVIGLVKDYLSSDTCKNGYILDGFPRSIPQAEALEQMGIEIDAVINIDVPDANIVDRMSGRRICSGCGASYHIKYQPPKKESVCDLCGNALYVRSDDSAETVLKRLQTYHTQTEPLKSFYEARGKVSDINGTLSQEEVSKQIFAVLDSFKRKMKI